MSKMTAYVKSLEQLQDVCRYWANYHRRQAAWAKLAVEKGKDKRMWHATKLEHIAKAEAYEHIASYERLDKEVK